MSLMTYEIRDPIHGTIVLSEFERPVVDHRWVQRLRHIRQLGFVSGAQVESSGPSNPTE